MKAVAYIRVSTREQDEEVQKKGIAEFAKAKGFEILEYFVDKGVSGTQAFASRLGARQLLGYLSLNRVDLVIVWSIDRIGRSMLDTLNSILLLEEKYGVKVVSVKEEWLQSLDQNIRKLVLSILSWAAEFERRRIRERQEEAWRLGKQKGRPRKVRLDVVRKYLERYRGLPLTAILKIMRADGYSIGYSTLRRYVKELKASTSATS